MTDETALDRAHAAMQAAPDDAAARLGYYEKLAVCELFLMLKDDPGSEDESVTPEIFVLEDASYVLAFDREERLASFAGGAVPYVALSGRAIAGMLAGARLGLAVNLETAPSSILLPPDAVAWLHETLGNAPRAHDARIDQVHPPAGLPDRLLAALDARLAAGMGLARAAYLAGVTYRDGGRGHLLAFVAALPAAEDALAQTIADALTFSGIEAGALDVAFLRVDDPVVARLERVGLRFDLPQLPETETSPQRGPGMDPEKPPRLK